MNRSDLINKLAEKYHTLAHRDAAQSVARILDAMAATLARGERGEISGFDSFTVNQRPPRSARNPMTGEQVQVPAKAAPHFKPGKELRERVNLKEFRNARQVRIWRHLVSFPTLSSALRLLPLSQR